MNVPQMLSASGKFPDGRLTTIEIIQNNGYSVEAHNVTTEDGYILELHRIPRNMSGQEPTRNHPVFIHHGLLGSSADWVLGGAKVSLPMQLADDGYDVWMANCRGNTYSRKHVSLTWKQKDYWNFSLNEIGIYDLPASFDYILIHTNSSQLHYIGFSMGTCVFFIMASERPEYQPKIRSQISLAPVANLFNTRSTIRYLAPFAKMLNTIFQRMSGGMMLPQSKLQKLFASIMCREKMIQKLICEKYFIFSVCGSDPYDFDSQLIPSIMGQFPAGTSAKVTSHFAQLILKDTFGKFDYGSALNLRHYKSTEPPTYDLKSINVPITLIYGENDLLTVPQDVMRLKAQLPKLMDAYPVKSLYFNHVDFLWSLRVKEHVNDPIADILRKTDDMNWRYSGPDTLILGNDIGDGDRKGTYNVMARPQQTSFNELNFTLGMNYFLKNLDTIITSTMPRSVDFKNTVDFDWECQQQKVLFGHVIQNLKDAEKEHGQLPDGGGAAPKVEDWMGGVAIGGSDARKAMEKRVTDTTVMVNGMLAIGCHTLGDSIHGKNSIVDVVYNAEQCMVGGIAQAEHSVVGSITNAEQSMVGSIAKAECSVVGGITNVMKHCINYGLTKADHAIGNTLNTTSKGLNRVFLYLKLS